MSGVLTLQIPPLLDARARCIAQALQRPVEEVLLETLDTALPQLDDVPASMINAIAQLPQLDDAALWRVARAMLDSDIQPPHTSMDECLIRSIRSANLLTAYWSPALDA
jgi:hypothetical protein